MNTIDIVKMAEMEADAAMMKELAGEADGSFLPVGEGMEDIDPAVLQAIAGLLQGQDQGAVEQEVPMEEEIPMDEGQLTPEMFAQAEGAEPSMEQEPGQEVSEEDLMAIIQQLQGGEDMGEEVPVEEEAPMEEEIPQDEEEYEDDGHDVEKAAMRKAAEFLGDLV